MEKQYQWNTDCWPGGCCLCLGLCTIHLTPSLTLGLSCPSACTGWMLTCTRMAFCNKPDNCFWDKIWVQGVHSKDMDGRCQLWLFPLRAALQNYPGRLLLLSVPIHPCTIPATPHILCAKMIFCSICRNFHNSSLVFYLFLWRNLFKRIQCWLNSICSCVSQQYSFH